MAKAIAILADIPVQVDVASTPQEQAQGLQGRSSLNPGQGLLFPFPQTRRATFHAASVSFPFDIIFVRDGHIAEIVSDIQPGSQERFTATASHVVEVPGGFCSRHGIERGDTAKFHFLTSRVQADLEAYDAPLEATEPGDHSLLSGQPAEERFREHDLPPEANPNAHDQPFPLYQNIGYDPSLDRNRQEEGPPMRPSASMRHQGQELPPESSDETELSSPRFADPSAFALGVMKALSESANGMPWQEDELNGGATESAVVTPQLVTRWLSTIGASSPTVLSAATSPEGMDIVGDSLILGGIADYVRSSPDGTSIVVFRKRHYTR